MDIIIGGTQAVLNDSSKENIPFSGAKKVVRRERREEKVDRRKSVREGILVSLSMEKDRRVLRNRRRTIV